MSRKAFLIWGLAIISFAPIITAVVQFLGLSKIIPHGQSTAFIKQAAIYLAPVYLIGIPLSFGTIFYLRFKEIGRRKRFWALFMFFFMCNLMLLPITPNFLVTFYDNHIVKDSGAMTRFWAAAVESSKQTPHQSVTPWTFKHVLDFVLINLPSQFLAQISFFAFLWFGNLDPRTPSKNRFVQFMKTGFQRKEGPAASSEFTQAALG